MSVSSEDLSQTTKTKDRDEPKVASSSKNTLDYSSDLIPLEAVEGPTSPTLQFDSEATANLVELKVFKTSMDSKTFNGDANLFNRRAIALELGAAYMQRTYGGNGHYDPDQVKLTRASKMSFRNEILLLDEALEAQVVKFKDLSAYGFMPCAKYNLLIARLTQLYSQVTQAGIELDFRVPWWGKRSDDNLRFWSANDYEILAVCFRYDIENYLGTLNEFFNNRLTVVIPTSFKGKKRERDLPPHIEIPATPEQEVQELTERISHQSDQTAKGNAFETGLGSIQQKQASLFSGRPTSLGTTNLGLFQSPNRLTSARALSEMFEGKPKDATPKPSPKFPIKEEEDPSDEPDSSDSDIGTPPPRRKSDIPTRHLSSKTKDFSESLSKEAHFDLKLKPDVIPEWDGDPDTLALWILKVNSLGNRSSTIFNQLGQLIPTRLRKGAEAWYYSLPSDHRLAAENSWKTMREIIGGYYMNRTWLDKQKMRARSAHYREANYSQEKPSEYYIRKTQLLSLVFNLSDSEVIMEVMNSAPSGWTSVLTTHLYENVVDFQTALKFHEDALMKIGNDERRRDYLPSFSRGSQFSNPKTGFRTPAPSGSSQPKARAFAIGSTNTLGKPPFPKDDSNYTKRNKTPAQANARPCRHCGSSLHWDFECKHAVQGNKKARANSARHTDEYIQALEEYEELFYSSDLDLNLVEFPETSEEDIEQDFQNPPSF